MTKAENSILLFSITLCWSAAYLFVKSLPPELSAFAYLTLTTGIAALVLFAVFAKRLRLIRKSAVKSSLILSLILTVNLLLEKKGIEALPPSNASFLAALTVLMVPLLMLFVRQKPSRNNAVGAVVIVIGLCLGNRFSLSAFISKGTLYMLLGCVCAAVYTVVADRFTKREDPLLISMMQMGFTAVTAFFLWFIENPRTVLDVNYTREMLSSIFILAFFGKAYAYVVLMFSQKYSDPVSVIVIMSTEPVVTLMLAVLIPAAYGGNEPLTVFSFFGAIIITGGVVIAGSNFFTRKTSAKEEKTLAHKSS